ncbi:3-isopropylmalate dehydrogenase [Actinoallomurus iriomotensis]|uniref:3-isopropylmalate dehydrogenase n=1 Tax=Actinoallomurus iriomotensis TaxID=478107 RepID=A0A9W6S260_9ACTN|nr:3-isopropylmalate dehydrogenase [Actinoallomurus iriomotensis]GLY84257.1 3-isopropylmalate dehydrogenase [Actinoallomurus iriomotensis]
MASRSIRLAVVPGDGIGPEVVAEGLKVLDALGLTIEQTVYELGAAYWHKTGEVLPDATLEEIRGHDAILLGAVGDPSVPSGVLERGLLLKLRFELDHYINLRPVRLYPGVGTPLAGVRPEDIDMMVVREGTEGLYAGAGGVLRKGTPQEIATQESINTAFGVERTVRYAFELAARRPRKKLTLVHKNNVLVYAGDLWSRTVDAVAKEFTDVDVDYCHVDAATMYFVSQPARFDVIVTDNLFGDIITDLGAAVAGGIGLAASGNLNPSGAAPSMFEPVHGSAPDIAGQGKADPTATVLSVALLLDHLGLADEARRVEQAVADDIIERQGAWAARSTREAGDDIAERVAG